MAELDMEKAFTLSKEEALKRLKSDAGRGLGEEESKARLSEYGHNELVEQGAKSALAILFDQLKEVMVFILFAAALVSFILGEYIDGSVILVILILNTMLGFWQEMNAEKAMAALKKLTVPIVRVRRGGQVKELPAKELVPGDIVIIEAGNVIPADGRLIESSNLKVQEAALTGESEPVEKSVEQISDENKALADRKNMLYMGTIVTYGRGEAVVTATGMKTELGKIAGLLHSVEDEATPLQKRLAKLGTNLALMAGALILVVILINFFTVTKADVSAFMKPENLKLTFMTAISMAVAAIPEGLPAIVTIALALGAQKMLKSKALIRNLPAVETLGSVTIICSDKTGTLTQNKMTVTELIVDNSCFKMDDVAEKGADSASNLLLTTGLLCNDAVMHENETDAIGDPTEGSLVIAGKKVGLIKSELELELPRAAELPFDSVRKRMTTIHELAGLKNSQVKEALTPAFDLGTAKYVAFTKGSVDGIMNIADKVLVDGKVVELTEEYKLKIMEHNQRMASNGVRVLGMAVKRIDDLAIAKTDQLEEDLLLVGMTGMIDPARPEVKDAVATCKSAGIRPIMITGDHPLTALAIAKELGICENDNYLTGNDLSQMTVAELEKSIFDVSVYARVSPEHKMKLINAMQDKGQIVSMTGDGVNDAPALKSADIGVAMGITGTDVAKDSSDMVLLDDNFSTIVKAVKEGRTIYDNIKKFIKYILTGNTGEIVVMLLGPLFGLPIPLIPIQILWINLVTDGLPAIALGYEPAEKDTMQRPPYSPKEGIFSRGLGRQILMTGALVGATSLLAGFLGEYIGREIAVVGAGGGHDVAPTAWRTMVFSTLTICQMMFALTVRSNRKSFFTTSILTNKMIVPSVIVTLLLQMALIYVPFFNTVFKTVPLEGWQLGICFGGALVILVYTEVEKLILKLMKR